MTYGNVFDYEVEAFVQRNKYMFSQNQWMLSRCIDDNNEGIGRSNPLVKPGADVGDFIVVKATCQEYGIELDNKNILSSLIEIVGGSDKINIHTLSSVHQDDSHYRYDCDYLKQAVEHLKEYGLLQDIKWLDSVIKRFQKKSIKTPLIRDSILKGVLIVKSSHYSINPVEKTTKTLNHFFVYQKTLDDMRRRILAEKLTKRIEGLFKPDSEYMYEVMSSVSDEHLIKTLHQVARRLPLYEITIDASGIIVIKNKFILD